MKMLNSQTNILDMGKCCFCGEDCNPQSQACGGCNRSMSLCGVSNKTGSSDFYSDRIIMKGKVIKKGGNVDLNGWLWIGDPYSLNNVIWENLGKYNSMQYYEINEKGFNMYKMNLDKYADYVIKTLGKVDKVITDTETIVIIPKTITKILDKNNTANGVYVFVMGNGIKIGNNVKWKNQVCIKEC